MKFKIGDRVRVTEEYKKNNTWLRDSTVGVVEIVYPIPGGRIENELCSVNFPEGNNVLIRPEGLQLERSNMNAIDLVKRLEEEVNVRGAHILNEYDAVIVPCTTQGRVVRRRSTLVDMYRTAIRKRDEALHQAGLYEKAIKDLESLITGE